MVTWFVDIDNGIDGESGFAVEDKVDPFLIKCLKHFVEKSRLPVFLMSNKLTESAEGNGDERRRGSSVDC